MNQFTSTCCEKECRRGGRREYISRNWLKIIHWFLELILCRS